RVHRYPHAFPTRRSSDLPTVGVKKADGSYSEDWSRTRGYLNPVSLIDNNTFDGKNKTFLVSGQAELKILDELLYTVNISSQDERSEEHTSELQSRENLVC